jgi:nucleoside-diphosphate-sugar epimerase
VVHEADLARAIHLVVRQDVTGVYNVAADDAPPVLDLVRETGGKVIPMSAFAIKALMALMWQAGKSVFAPEWIVLFQYPLVVSNEKLKALGWKPAHTSRSAFTALRSQSPAQNMPGGMPNTAAKDGQA